MWKCSGYLHSVAASFSCQTDDLYVLWLNWVAQMSFCFCQTKSHVNIKCSLQLKKNIIFFSTKIHWSIDENLGNFNTNQITRNKIPIHNVQMNKFYVDGFIKSPHFLMILDAICTISSNKPLLVLRFCYYEAIC